MRWLRTLSLLTLTLLSCGTVNRVAALRVASVSLSNATVSAPTELLVSVDFEGASIAADAIFTLAVHPQLLLYDDPSGANVEVDTALLTSQLDGALLVSVVDADVTIVRGVDATEVTPSGNMLTFRLTHLTAPRVAGAISLGSFLVGNATDATAFGSVPLPSVWIAPGRIRNAQIEFGNLISSRLSTVNVTFSPTNNVPINGSVLVQLPRLYSAASAVLEGLTLVSATTIDGEVTMTVVGSALRFASFASGLNATQMVKLQLDGLRHPLLEGPIGRSVRVQTTDADNNIIDEALIDVSGLLLERATVQLSERRLLLQEADDTGVQYAISLTAPPTLAPGVSVAITARVSNLEVEATSLLVEPTFVTFTAMNWSESVNITVRALDDEVALPSATRFVLSHELLEAATELSFAPVDDVIVFVDDDDLPLVQLSSRYVAVAEDLRNDSYDISLLARPSSDVTVEIVSLSSLVSVFPETVTFTSSAWAAVQTVRVEANSAGSSPSTAVRTRLTHRVSSVDSMFSAIVPQSNVLVYYEPFEMVSCVEPCRPGWYSAINSSTDIAQCVACPLGHYCPGECVAPVPCLAGTHSSVAFATNSSVCEECAVGSYANTAGRSVCASCPGGAACPRTDASFEPCPVGSFALESQGSCRPCPIGTHSNSTFRDRCDSCPAGSYCAGGTAPPTTCLNGTYSIENGTKPCESCPAGYSCSNSSVVPSKCPDGSFSPAGDTQCRVCAQGYYCPNPALAPIPCGQGTYSHAGAIGCTLCPLGHMCKFPDLPKACSIGEISNGNHSACINCPPGYACPVAAATPVQCAAGSFSTGGAMVCTVCAAGYACPDTTSTQRIPCLAGTYSVGGAASCTPCPAGYACPTNNSATFTPCPSGWYSPEGSAACTECPRGYFCDVPYELPKNCTLGSYSMKASTSCVPCDPGYECPRSDQLPQPCPVGYYSGGAVANCKACRPGYKCSLASDNPTPPEDACPMGGYCNPPTTFFLCPAGTFGNVTAGESVDQACAPCPDGFYCEMGSTPLTKQNCPAGYVCPIGTKRASQFPCPAGSYSPLANQFSLDACRLCPAGSFCVQGSANPVVCPQGYYCPEGTLAANQFPCPAGTYSGPRTGLEIASQCQPCELGAYCPEASSSPTACPAGTYNALMGAAKVHECLDCPPGWSCPQVGQFEYVDRCAKGHFCPSGTVVATAKPCPAGTYTERIDLIRAEDCTICPLSHACPEGTGGEAQTMLDCGAGFFCPNGTAHAKQFPCPPGYWSSSTSLADASECEICPVGKYCSGGKSFVDGPCSPGYYCPLGTPSPTKFPCPSGTYTAKTWLFEPSQCDDCPPGYYCPAGSVAPIPCKPGSFSSFNNTKTVGPGIAWPQCVTCPAGYYCAEAAVVPAPCGKGSFSTTGSKSCSKCEAGFFCNSNTTSDTNMRTDVVSWLAPGALFGKCYNGTYCPPGSDHEPALEIDACPRGYFCPKAIPAPVICPAGTYSNLTGQDDMSDCIPTPAGFFSLEGALQPTGPCDPGFYCPIRSTARTQIPCPARYYLNRTGGRSEEDCAVCVAGSYCPRGSAYPVICPTGSYCRTGVSSPEPCPIGTYSNATGIKHVEDCLVCPPGMYCDSTGLTVPRGPCDPGYYCTLGSYTSAPMSYETTLFGVTNRNVGGQCPRGSFCPLKSAFPTPCPPGTYNNFTGLEVETQCVQCPPGKYCETPGLVLPTGDCFSGYYCTGGANTPTQNATPPGSFTGNGSTAPIPCPAGQFNAHAMQEQCVDCPAGFFCGSPGTIRPAMCPMGHFCPKSTALAIKCPTGTLNALEGIVSVLQCQSCPAGFFCDSFGLAAPSGQCLEGFVCSSGSPVSNPIAADYGFVCPAGHYCPIGSGAATPCPPGSFRPSTGGTDLASCSLCPGGTYCGTNALTAPSGPCSHGYFCTLNVSTSTPSGDAADGSGGPCPKGSFCPEGSSLPQLCPEGTYSDEPRAPVCALCPAGYFCPLGSAGYASHPCPQGYYCPVGTKRNDEFPCLPGTYGNRTGLQDVSQCTPAPGGMYIEGHAAVKASGLCKSGFYCSGGSSTSTPPTATSTGGPCLPGTNCPEGSAVPIVCDAGAYCSSTNTDKALPCDPGFYCIQGSYTANPTGQINSLGMIGDVCMPGHYCPQGTSNPIPCPPSTFSGNPQNHNVSQCLPCPPGFICRVSGIVKPYEQCPAGFICTGGEQEATQRCPKGYECPLGSSEPRACPPGSFGDEDGLGLCKLCPERYYCAGGTVTPDACPEGYFCPLQTPQATKYPCPPGTFSNATLLASRAECALCSPGKFCSGAAPTDRPSGDCAPGHYCIGGATTATPTDGTTGDLCAGGFVCLGGAWLPDPIDGVMGAACEPGFYCPRGSSLPVRCAKGSYNAFEKQSSCVACPAGGYCDTNATAPVPCPIRYFCKEATAEPVLCPSGTYGHATALESADQCAPCAAGKFCVAGTLTASCSAGYYCKLYNLEPNPQLANATAALIASKPLGFDFGGPCPVGHYCPEGVLDPIPCPDSTARLETHGTSVDDCGPCPAGMSCANGAFTVSCPAGQYCAHAQSAVACPAGTYNPVEGQAKLADCKPCLAGKLCNSTAITDLTELYDCPSGHYCLEASTSPAQCPKGRFRRTRGATAVDDCALCTGGSFCGIATVEPTVCDSRVYCPTGSGEPLPCPGGSYCPYNSSVPLPCPAGFYCPQESALPIECNRGFYCPAGSMAPSACPLGFIGRETALNGVLSRLIDACEPCPAGFYGVDPNRTRCDVCLEGFVCLEATRSSRPQSKEEDNGYPCPPGYYCPIGTSTELPCPSGSYQPNFRASNSSECLSCPLNSYQNNAGQPSCLPCSKSAFAGVGATVCTCKGSHRAFQMTDGYCICEPGYEFYDQDMVLRSDEDDDVDCQPIVYDRCGSDQVRSDGGACVPASQTSCEKSCGNSTGTLVSSLGICQCDKQADVDAVCDKKCRDTAMQLRVDVATGELQLYDPVSGTVESLGDRSSSLGIVSKVSCLSTGSGCQLHTIALSSGGFAGSYDLPANVGATSSSSSSSTVSPQALLSQQRRLTEDSPMATIANPMACLNVGQGIFFDLSAPGAYPIYLKDSMLNTNPTFDYGAFRALATRVKSNTSTVSAFAFSFTEAGIYVFGSSLNGAAKTVITVMQTGTSCPTEAAIVPLSEKNLISVSVKRRTDDIILAPDWGLIIGLLGGLVGMVVAVIAGLYYFRTKSWATSSTRQRLLGYRAKSKATDLATMHSKGVAVANKATASQASAAPIGDAQQATLTPAPVMVLDDGKPTPLDSLSPRWSKNLAGRGDRDFQPDLARWEEEDLDLRELVDRLQQHHDAVTKCFDDQKGDVQSLLQHLQNEAAELKRLLMQALTSGAGASSHFAATAQVPVDALASTALVQPVSPDTSSLTTSGTWGLSMPLPSPALPLIPPTQSSPPLALLPAHTIATADPSVARSPTATTLTSPPLTAARPLHLSSPLTSPLGEVAVSSLHTSATDKLPPKSGTNITTALTVAPDELDLLRKAAEADAQAMVARQEQLRQEYVAMLQDKFPQLSSDEVQRLMDEFTGDLQRLTSSLNVEAQKAREDVKTMLTARTLMTESHERAMHAAAEHQNRALDQEQQRQLATLETKFAEEEDEIELEYQRELQQLEDEFAALGEAEGDEALALSDVSVRGHRAQDDAALEQLLTAVGDASVAIASRTALAAAEQAETDRLRAELTAGEQLVRDRDAMEVEARTKRPHERLAQRRQQNQLRQPSPVTLMVGADPALVALGATFVDTAIEDQLKRVYDQHAVDSQRRRDDLLAVAEERKATLRERLNRKKAAAAILRELASSDVPSEEELQAEEAAALRTIGADVADQLDSVDVSAAAAMLVLVERAEASTVDQIDDLDRLLSDCRSQYEREAAALAEQLARDRQERERALQERLAKRRAQRLAAIETAKNDAGIPISATEQEAIHAELVATEQHEQATLQAQLASAEQDSVELLRGTYSREIEGITTQLQDAVSRRHADAASHQNRAESELQRLLDEHKRERQALESAQDAERRRQQQLLGDKLAQRRAQALGAVPDEDTKGDTIKQLDAADELELVAQAAALDEQCEAARRDTRARHAHEEAVATKAVSEASGEVAATEATRLLTDAAREAELGRLARELENALSGTRTDEASDGAARKARLAQRLAKRRQQKMAEAMEQLAGKPVDERRRALNTLEKQLTEEDNKERLLFVQTMAQEETERLENLEAAQHRQSTEMLEQADRAAKDRLDQAHAAQAATEEELRKVRDEHERELASLKASLEAERRRQEQKLQDKLAARRAQRRAQGVSEDALAVEEALELAELQDALQQRGARAVEEERTRHDDREQSLVQELAQLSAQVTAAAAARVAIKAAREAEIQRIASEFEQNRRQSLEDDGADAKSWKAKLNDRLAQRRGRDKGQQGDATRDATSRQREDTQETLYSKAIVAEALDGAVDDELERIKRQYAESLERRVEQIEAEAAAKKAALRDRIDQKRRALAMKGSASQEDAAATPVLSAVDEQQLQEEQATAEAVIEEERATRAHAAADESERQQRAAREVLLDATNASGDELERLLEACQRAHANDADALRRALEQERLLKEQNLRDRLAQRRQQKLAEATRQQQQVGASEAEQAAARAAIEQALAEEDEREQVLLARALAEEEGRRLAEAENAEQRQAAEMMEQIERATNDRSEAARASHAAAEDELRRVREEHERESAALQTSLRAERVRHEQKLQDKLAARRAQRTLQQTSGVDVNVDDQAIAAEEALERIRVEDELQERAAQALAEARARHEAQEQAIATQIAQAAAAASAADAAKKAIEAARQAEIDRIAAEFDASRRRAIDDETAESQSRRAKLDDRLAQKRQRAKQKSEAPPTKASTLTTATKRVMAVQRSLRSITESQAEKAIERLRGEHAAACDERVASLEKDAALRKARLADRIAKKRSDARALVTATPDVARHNEEADRLERELERELEDESRAIDESVAAEKQKIADEIRAAQEHVKADLQAAAKRNAEEMEQLLLSCKSAHDEETKNLQRTLELERQRQEKALQDRIAKRKQQRQKAPDPQQQSNLSAETATATTGADENADDEREKRELEAQLEAKEAKVWEEMRRKQEEELLSLAKQAELAARKKQEEAKAVQESAQVELDRLKREHEAEMATLTASMETEQRRQQQQLQQRIAARRTKQQKQQKETDDAAEQERLAKQLEEQEIADKRALEEQMQIELERRMEQERERQRQQEAELIARVAQANIDAAAADAARKAMDAAREVELERLATEFDEKSRELRQSHMNDLVTQKQKLEARVAAKKQKKLMELEAKRESERQKLRELQEQEERAALAEQQRAQDAVDDALMVAAADAADADGDASAPPPQDAPKKNSDPTVVASTIEEAKRQLMEKLKQDKTMATTTTTTPSAAFDSVEKEIGEAARAAQQARDVAAIQQLFDTQVIPLRMPLLAAVELALSQRHQKESSLLLTQQHQRKTHAIRDALREIMQHKAMAKALMMRSHPPDDHETKLQELDTEFDERIRVAERDTIQAAESLAAVEGQQLKDQQLAELQFLLHYFSDAVATAVERLQQHERDRLAQAEQAARLHAMVAIHGDPLPRLRLFAGASNDTDDRINELRARLQLEADERIQELLTTKHSELQRLQSDLEMELRRISEEHDRLVEQERAAVEAAFLERVRGLASTSRQRPVLQSEKENQMTSLLLMLRGRRAQQEARTKRLLAAKLSTIEQEYDRKIQIVTAKMLQRLVEEKELLIKKQKALANATGPRHDDTTALDGGAESRVDDAERKKETEDHDEDRRDATSDLRRMLELRLTNIEGLIRNQHLVTDANADANTNTDAASKSLAPDVQEYKASLAQAIEDACEWRVVLHGVADAGVKTLDADGEVRVVPRDTLDTATQAHVDFANALVAMMATKATDSTTAQFGRVDRVVVVESLPPRKTSASAHDDKTGSNDATLTQFDVATRTLFVPAVCFAKLSVGQLALLLVHGVAEAQTQLHDVTNPQFVGCVYRLLVQCYQSLFLRSHTADDKNEVSAAGLATDPPRAHQPSVDRRVEAIRQRPGQWKSHVDAMESFLSGLEAATSSPSPSPSLSTDESSDTVSHATPPRLTRQSSSFAARSHGALPMALSSAMSSRRLLHASTLGSAASDEMEALVLHERRQFLQEKLDTAEKLYAHVLRQYQEQKQSLEYVHEMLEQEKETAAVPSVDAPLAEAKAALLERLDELHHEAEAVESALDKTRRERDELFAQCQALRDELEQLRPLSAAALRADAKS